MRVLSLILAFLGFVASATVSAASPQETVETTWRLLDYIAVDYAGAVRNGRVISDTEYAEMREFSDTVHKNLGTLPAGSAKAALVGRAPIGAPAGLGRHLAGLPRGSWQNAPPPRDPPFL